MQLAQISALALCITTSTSSAVLVDKMTSHSVWEFIAKNLELAVN